MSGSTALARLSTLTDRLGRSGDLDGVLTSALESLETLFGFTHSLLMMLDESGTTLYTIASRGYETPGIGSEVLVGEGVIGLVAAEQRSLRVGNLTRMLTYARVVRAAQHRVDIETRIPLPGLPAAASQMAAPAMVTGHLLGVLAVESDRLGAFDEEDEHLLTVVAHLVAAAIELGGGGGPGTIEDRPALDDPASLGRRPTDAGEPTGRPPAPPAPLPPPANTGPAADRPPVVVRFFPADGSTFVDGEYLIKGVAGRLLWRLLGDYERQGRTEFTNREIRLDPTLELPPFRDNFESRLVLLQRRLEERGTPMRLQRTGRGRFRLAVDRPVRGERVDP